MGQVSPLAFAVKKLASRARSASEIELLLTRRGYDPSDITATIQLLRKKGYLNDEEYAQSLFLSCTEHNQGGPLLLKKKLLAKGLEEDVVQNTLALYDEETELMTAGRLTDKYLLRSNASWPGLARFLERKGFSHNVIKKLLARRWTTPALDKP